MKILEIPKRRKDNSLKMATFMRVINLAHEALVNNVPTTKRLACLSCPSPLEPSAHRRGDFQRHVLQRCRDLQKTVCGQQGSHGSLPLGIF